LFSSHTEHTWRSRRIERALGARSRRSHARQCFRRLSFRGDLARIRHRDITSGWYDASHEGNACARMAAGEPDARRFPQVYQDFASILMTDQTGELSPRTGEISGNLLLT
jgi:hypothetical protein